MPLYININTLLTISEKYEIIELFHKKKMQRSKFIKWQGLSGMFYKYLALYNAINAVSEILGDDVKKLILAGNFGHGIGFLNVVEKVYKIDLSRVKR